MPRRAKKGYLSHFSTSIVAKQKIAGDALLKFFYKKVSMPKKLKGDPLVSPGIVMYAEKEEKPFRFSLLVRFRPNDSIWDHKIS